MTTRRIRSRYSAAISAADTIRSVAKQNEFDLKFVRNLNAAADQLEKTAKASPLFYGYPQYSVGLSAAIKGLQEYRDNPGQYAPGAYIGANGQFRALDPSDGADNKCNRFVADMIVAAGGVYPVRGNLIKGTYPASAEEVYTNDNIEGMRSISAKDAKVGDIISFAGHIGIYLGNGVYISARSNGVEVSEVPWEQNPKFKRCNERVNQRAQNSNNSGDETQNVSLSQQNQQTDGTLTNNSEPLENLQKKVNSISGVSIEGDQITASINNSREVLRKIFDEGNGNRQDENTPDLVSNISTKEKQNQNYLG
jgi:NlpC/P60 family